MEMFNPYKLAQVKSTSIFLEAALKEYAADWLKNADIVVRDETGRFAKKAASVGQEASQVKQAIEDAVKDPEAAKRKVSSELLKLTAKGLDKLVQKDPEFADKLLDKMFGVDAQQARDRLADLYGDINPGLPNAIRPDPLKETLGEILKQAIADKRDPRKLAKDLAKAFELAGYSYNKLIDDLNNVESESEAIKLLGKLAAMSIPLAGYLAATLTPEIAIGLLAGDTLATILTSAAATQAASFAANKAMDKMDVTNPWVRTGVDLAVGLGTGGAISAGARQLKKTKSIEQIGVFARKKLALIHQKIQKEAKNHGIKIPDFSGTSKGFVDFPPILKQRPKGIPDDIDFDQTPYGIGLKFEIENNKILLGIGDDGIVGFKINNKFDMDESLADNVKRRAAVKLTKLFKSVVSEIEDDRILWCNIHDKDGLKAAQRRLKAYNLMGFGEKIENTVYGIVKEGKLVPYQPSIEELNKIHGG